MIFSKREVCHAIRLASGVRAAGAGAHDDIAGSTQVLRQTLRRHPSGEIPAAATRLAALIVTQRIGQDGRDLLRGGGGEIGSVRVWLMVVGHEGKLGGEGERNKNKNRLTRW
jgi:hypothetical protein